MRSRPSTAAPSRSAAWTGSRLSRSRPEDHALAADPVEDRLHRVLDREDEAGRALRLLLEADVEPHRRVEGDVLVDQERLQLRLEGVGLLVGREVAAVTAPRADGGDDAADHLLHGALAVGRAHAASEVLLGDDVRRRLRPELRELDALLLEHGLSLPGMNASRISHSTSSNGSRPAIVKNRRTPSVAFSSATWFAVSRVVAAGISSTDAKALPPDMNFACRRASYGRPEREDRR